MSHSQIFNIGYPLEHCFNENAIGINGSINFPCRTNPPIELLGYRLSEHPVYLSKESPILERCQFQAIIGCDVLRRLPPTLIDFSTGHIHFLPRCATNILPHQSSRAIIDERDPIFDPTPSITQLVCPTASSQGIQKQPSPPVTAPSLLPFGP